MNEVEFEVSSGNVFADLGLPEAEERSLKAELAWTLGSLVEERGWTQSAAAQAIGCTQAEVSELCRGRTARFSVDRLLRFLRNLGMRVQVTVSPAEGSALTARTETGTAESETSCEEPLVEQFRDLIQSELAGLEARLVEAVSERVLEGLASRGASSLAGGYPGTSDEYASVVSTG